MRPRLLVAAAVLLLAFAGWTVYVLHRPALGPDIEIMRWIQARSWGPLGATFPVFSFLAGPLQDVLAGAVILLVAVVRRPAVWMMLAGAGEGVVYSVFNQALRRPRPSTHLVHVVDPGGGYGYPSGHAAFFLCFGALTVLALGWRRLPWWGFALVAATAAAILCDACLSRLYQGQHWPSDIVGGLLLGAGWVCLVLGIRRLSDPVFGRA